MLFLINAQAQRLVTVIQAVPRNLAVVMDQVRAQKEARARKTLRNSNCEIRNGFVVVALVSGRPGKAEVAAMQPGRMPKRISRPKFGTEISI